MQKNSLQAILYTGGKMDREIENGILFSIQQSIDKVIDEKQLLRFVKEYKDYYRLKIYGYDLKFNKIDGGLINE